MEVSRDVSCMVRSCLRASPSASLLRRTTENSFQSRWPAGTKPVGPDPRTPPFFQWPERLGLGAKPASNNKVSHSKVLTAEIKRDITRGRKRDVYLEQVKLTDSSSDDECSKVAVVRSCKRQSYTNLTAELKKRRKKNHRRKPGVEADTCSRTTNEHLCTRSLKPPHQRRLLESCSDIAEERVYIQSKAQGGNLTASPIFASSAYSSAKSTLTVVERLCSSVRDGEAESSIPQAHAERYCLNKPRPPATTRIVSTGTTFCGKQLPDAGLSNSINGKYAHRHHCSAGVTPPVPLCSPERERNGYVSIERSSAGPRQTSALPSVVAGVEGEREGGSGGDDVRGERDAKKRFLKHQVRSWRRRRRRIYCFSDMLAAKQKLRHPALRHLQFSKQLLIGLHK